MASTNYVVYAILKFLDDQQRSPDLTPDAVESLEDMNPWSINMDCHGLKILGFTHLCNLSMVDCLSLSSIHSNVPSLTFSFTCAGHNAASYLSFDPSDNTRRVTVLLVLPSCAVNVQVASQCLESAYGITIRDVDACSLYPLPASLQHIFAVGLSQMSAPTLSVADREAAEKLKGEGNELMRQDQYSAAVEAYTRAIQIDGSNAVYYCNRAAAYGKMGEPQRSIDDCMKALELDPKYGKAYGRMGLAQTALGAHSEAKTCYQRALELDPANETYQENLRQSEQQLGQDNGMGAVPGALGGLNLGGLDLSSMLSNPALMNMATSMLSNPQMQQMMANMMSGASNQPGGTGPHGMSSLLQAGQQLAQQMQQSNPELVEQLRSQMQGQATETTNTSANSDQSQHDGQLPPDASS